MVEKNFFDGSQKLFKFFRIWSYHEGDNNTLLDRFLKFMTIICAGLILTIISLTETIQYMQHEGEIAVALTKGLYVFALCVCTHKMSLAAFADDDICACIKQMQSMSSKFKNTSDIEKCLKLYKKLFVLGMCCTITCSSLYLIAPLTTGEYRPLIFKPNLSFFNIEKTPNWHLIYLYESICIFVVTFTVMAYDTLFCGLMCLCSGILSSISREILEFDNYIEDHQMSDAKMKETIDKINEITQLITKISDTFSMTTMSHMIYNCNTMALGLFMVTILPFTDITFISMVSVIVLVTFQLWIYCYFGQNVVSKRDILRKDLCFIRWYDASQNFKTMLLLTIFESQNDRYIYAGKVVPLSLEIFTQVIKKAYAFFTFLNESR